MKLCSTVKQVAWSISATCCQEVTVAKLPAYIMYRKTAPLLLTYSETTVWNTQSLLGDSSCFLHFLFCPLQFRLSAYKIQRLKYFLLALKCFLCGQRLLKKYWLTVASRYETRRRRALLLWAARDFNISVLLQKWGSTRARYKKKTVFFLGAPCGVNCFLFYFGLYVSNQSTTEDPTR